MSPRFVATYLIETPYDIEPVAVEMIGEQSTSTHSKVAGETEELITNHGARLEGIQPLEAVDYPSLPSDLEPHASYNRARVKVSWPILNIGSSLGMLWSTVLGNQTGMRRLTGIRLEHLELPQEFVAQTPRPQFGISGTRQLTGVYDRPLIGCIIKPNVGLSPAQTADAARALIDGGVDFIKDDELIANPSYSPLAERVEAVMKVVNDAAERTGRKAMYAFNISDDFDEMNRHHDTVLTAGGTCVMVNLNSVGLSGLIALRKRSQLAIHAHRAGWATLTRSPLLGMGYQPYQMIHRLAGADHMHVSGLGRKFWEHKSGIFENGRSLLQPIGKSTDDRALPVFSGGSTVLDVAETYQGIGTIDVLMTSGGGIASHPRGLSAGCNSLRQAWKAAVDGIDLDEFARTREDLADAIAYVRAKRRNIR